MNGMLQRMKVWLKRFFNSIYITIIVILFDSIALCLLFITWLGVSFNKDFLISFFQNVAFDLATLVVAISVVDLIRDRNRQHTLKDINSPYSQKLKIEVEQTLTNILQHIDLYPQKGLSGDKYVSYTERYLSEVGEKFVTRLKTSSESEREEFANQIFDGGFENLFPYNYYTKNKAHFLKKFDYSCINNITPSLNPNIQNRIDNIGDHVRTIKVLIKGLQYNQDSLNDSIIEPEIKRQFTQLCDNLIEIHKSAKEKMIFATV